MNGGGLGLRLPLGRTVERVANTPCAAFSSGSKLFIGGLSYDTNEVALKDAFSRRDDVVEVEVTCHPMTGRSKGYSFVKFSLENKAAAALKKMSNEVLDGTLCKHQMICF